MPEGATSQWEELEQIVRDGGDAAAFLESIPEGDRALVVSRLSEDARQSLLRSLDPEDAADLIEVLPEAQAKDAVEGIEPDRAAAIVHELWSDAAADLLQDVEPDRAEAILAELDPAEAAGVRALSRYPEDVAGGLMVKEYLAFPESATVSQVIDDLRQHAEEYADYDVQYAYVTEERRGRLIGVLRLRDLLLAPPGRPLADIMIRDPLSVRDTATLEELEDFFEAHAFFGVPVVDADGRLIGVVHRDDVEAALADRSEDALLKTQGIVGGEELRTMPLGQRCLRRLSWLTPNIGLNLISASVISLYQDTLEQVVALAVFLPIISDMSGCSGNQAVGVSMRELSLGLVKPGEAARVWLKELGVGIVNGLALGILVGLIAWVWKESPWLGAVVGGALAVNTVVAVSVGGVVPLLLKRIGIDPALASSPILTTVTDMCGFFLALLFASIALARLTV